MSYTEEASVFFCEGHTLIGVLARPAVAQDTGVVVIVGGPQYRAGSHRQFVLLSRALAVAGFAVLRFDCRGMGDSEGEQRSFEAISADVAAAIDKLQVQVPSVKRVALWGLCDGASAALLYCHETQDQRIAGLCLLNPWVRTEGSLARTQVKHYYTQRLQQLEFWVKLVSGKIAVSALSSFLKKFRVAISRVSPVHAAKQYAPFQQRMGESWHAFSGQILLILSDDDYTAKEFLEYVSDDPAWKNALTRIAVVRQNLPDTDHTFSSRQARAHVEELTLKQGLKIAKHP